MSRMIYLYPVLEVKVLIPDSMTEEEAMDELYQNTAYTIEETENIIIVDHQLIDVTNSYLEDLEEDEEESPSLEDEPELWNKDELDDLQYAKDFMDRNS